MADSIREIAEALHQFAIATWPRTAQQTADLGFMEYLALDYLARHDAPTVGEVKRAIQALPAQMSRMIRALEDRNFVRCELNRQDKRKIDVTLTKNGLKAYQTFRDARVGALEDALEVLTEREREQIYRIALKLKKAYRSPGSA